jgi:hypothetical protein
MTVTPELIASIVAGILAALAWLDRFIDKRRTQAEREKLATATERSDEITLLRRELVTQYDRARTDVDMLRERISKLEMRNDVLNDQVILLERERAWLQAILAQNNIVIPPMPVEWAGGRQITAQADVASANVAKQIVNEAPGKAIEIEKKGGV